jgi:cell division protein FtsW (lipid II flippase)
MTLTESEKTKQKIGALTNFTLFLNFVLVLVLFFCSFFGDKSGRWIFLFPQSFFFSNFKKKEKKWKMLKAVVGTQTRELANQGRLPQKSKAIRVAAGRREGR